MPTDEEKIAKILMKIYCEDNCNEINEILMLIGKLYDQKNNSINGMIWDGKDLIITAPRINSRLLTKDEIDKIKFKWFTIGCVWMTIGNIIYIIISNTFFK